MKRQKVGQIEREFFEGSGSAVDTQTIRLSVVEGLLAPYLKPDDVAVFVV